MKKLLHDFFKYLVDNKIELYNEFSFQHELGMYLRKNIQNRTVQFERNVSHFSNFNKRDFLKKETDIIIYSDPVDDLHCAIELKFAKNMQIPEKMYSFCKDIAFLEQLKQRGFKHAYFIAVATRPPFYEGKKINGIYGHFRNRKPIEGTITKPTGTRDTQVRILNSYIAEWKHIRGEERYCLIEIK